MTNLNQIICKHSALYTSYRYRLYRTHTRDGIQDIRHDKTTELSRQGQILVDIVQIVGQSLQKVVRLLRHQR